MDHAWTVPAHASFDSSSSASSKAGMNNLENEDCVDRPSKTLRRPRGRPPLHPSPTIGKEPHEETGRKRTWKRKNAHCSPSELREQHLHRNRVAASKYRQKNKAWSDTLAERCRAETDKRKYLQDLTRSLKEEVLSLKERAIHQSGCDCMIMKLYLERQTVSLLGLPCGSPISPLATNSQDSISPTSSSFTSSFDDNFFSDFI
jgi:hypothetical protein